MYLSTNGDTTSQSCKRHKKIHSTTIFRSVEKLGQSPRHIRHLHWCETYFRGRASFWRDAYTVREICVRKFGNAYQRKEIEKRMTQTTQRKKMFANRARFPLKVLAHVPWLFSSCVVWDILRTSPAFCVRCTHRFDDFAYSSDDFYAKYTQKSALTRPLLTFPSWISFAAASTSGAK